MPHPTDRRIRRFAAPLFFLLVLALLVMAIGSFISVRAPRTEPAQPERIKSKAQQVGSLVKAGRANGLDPRPIMDRMNEAKDLMRSGEFEAAERLVDEALTLAEGDAETRARATEEALGAFEKLVVTGDSPRNGFYDPSLVYTPDGSVGWLTYSSCYGDEGPPAYSQFISTHVAKSTDHGATWTFQKKVNASVPGVIRGKIFGEDAGTWHYEVSSMAHDAEDIGREWKMFAHKIFSTVKDRNRPQYSFITMKHASDPAGTWSEEIPLFAARMPKEELAQFRYRVGDLDGELGGILVVSEPSALVRDGVLYLAMTGLDKRGAERILLVASDDHGQSWRYAGTLATRRDAEALGLRGLDGANLYVENGRTYLMTVAVGSAKRPEWNHYGTLLFEIEDLAHAKVKRADGLLEILQHLEPLDLNSGNHGGGQAAYDPHNTNGGILFPQINLAAMPEFAWVFKTNVFPNPASRADLKPTRP